MEAFTFGRNSSRIVGMSVLETPMYLVPVKDPRRAAELRKKAGMTPEVVEQRKKEFRESLERYRKARSAKS